MFTGIKESDLDLEQYTHIGDGSDAQVYLTPDNTVLMYTWAYPKIRYMFKIGLVVAYHGYYYLRTARIYVVELVKLEPVQEDMPEYTYILNASQDLRDIWRTFRNELYHEATRRFPIHQQKWDYMSRESTKFIKALNPAEYPLFKDALEFLQETRANFISLDIHAGNFMLCPVTNTIINLDGIMF